MENGVLPGLGVGLAKRRRGRPPGAVGKRSLDLGRYVEAHFGGMTPGQQAAQLGMVTAKELKAAKGELVLAMALKARELALHLDCAPALAWKMMQDERSAVMPYVHQKLAPKGEEKARGRMPVVVVGALDERAEPIEGGGWSGQDDDDDLSFLDAKPEQVSPSKSHEGGQPLALQGPEPADTAD